MLQKYFIVLVTCFFLDLSLSFASSKMPRVKDIENQLKGSGLEKKTLKDKGAEKKKVQKTNSTDTKRLLHGANILVMVATSVISDIIFRTIWDANYDIYILPELLIVLVVNILFYELIDRYLCNKDCLSDEKESCHCLSQRKCCKAVAYGTRTLVVGLGTALLVQTFILGGLGYWSDETFGKFYALDANEIESARSGIFPFNESLANQTYSFTLMSDPQYKWEGAPQTNIDQARALSVITDSSENRPFFNIINGDLTAYGHPDEVQKTFVEFYPHDTIKVPTYIGLGNHDYQNNVEGCRGPMWSIFTTQKNWCANYMIKIMKDYIAHRNHIYSYDSDSLSYSWDFLDLHFVQLQNYLGYTDSRINIEDGTSWLIEDLKEAKQLGKITIINQHIPYRYKLSELLSNYDIDNVCVVFGGHLHSVIGYFTSITNKIYNNLPIYLSGSAQYNSILLVEYKKDEQLLTIYSVQTNEAQLPKNKVAQLRCAMRK